MLSDLSSHHLHIPSQSRGSKQEPKDGSTFQTSFKVLCNTSADISSATRGGLVPPSFWQADVLGWSCRQMPYFAAPIGCEFKVPWVRSEGGEGQEEEVLLRF